MTIHLSISGQGMPLVLFHGWGFDSRIWGQLTPHLIQHYTVILVDLPGFGLTPSLGWEAFQKELLARLPEKFAMVGWSLGGLVAMRIACEAVGRVSHLVCIASSPKFVSDDSWPGVPFEKMHQFKERLQKEPQKVLNEFTALQVPGCLGNAFASPTIEGLTTGLEWLLRWDLREAIKTLALPVLFMFGRLDSIVPSATMGAMQRAYPQFEYQMVKKSAHSIFLTHTEEVVAALYTRNL